MGGYAWRKTGIYRIGRFFFEMSCCFGVRVCVWHRSCYHVFVIWYRTSSPYDNTTMTMHHTGAPHGVLLLWEFMALGKTILSEQGNSWQPLFENSKVRGFASVTTLASTTRRLEKYFVHPNQRLARKNAVEKMCGECPTMWRWISFVWHWWSCFNKWGYTVPLQDVFCNARYVKSIQIKQCQTLRPDNVSLPPVTRIIYWFLRSAAVPPGS